LGPLGLDFASVAPAAQIPSNSVSSSSGGGGAKKKQVTTSAPLSSEFDDSFRESTPGDYSAYTCQGCSFTNVQLLNNSFLENFLPGGCAALPAEGIDYQPWSKGPIMRVSYSITDQDALVYRHRNCAGVFYASARHIAQKKANGGRPSPGDGGK
jgi:hypothetical protein